VSRRNTIGTTWRCCTIVSDLTFLGDTDGRLDQTLTGGTLARLGAANQRLTRLSLTWMTT